MSTDLLKTMFSRMLGTHRTASIVLDERQRPLLNRLVEFVVDKTDPRIRMLAHYQNKVAPAATSRADSVIARLASCAVAALVANARRESAAESVG